jgi:peptide/nickel transport system ATP-binding protein
MRALRGDKVSMIFQDPLSALHPFYPVGNQIAEAYLVHHKVTKKEARDRAIEMLKRVGIPRPERQAGDYPHQFSGGMRQRAMIAMSLVCNPELLIADEPTTALDVTVQAQILDLIRDLQQEYGSAVVLITHDLGVVAQISDDVLVMYGGRRIEYGSVQDVLSHPEHPYTWGLLRSMPSLSGDVRTKLTPIKGTPPSLINLPSGCAFNPRCTFKDRVPDGRCTTERPELRPMAGNDHHIAACHLTDDQKAEIRGIHDRRMA